MNKINKKIILVFMIMTLFLYALFLLLTFQNYQVLNYFSIDILKNNAVLEPIISTINNVQDIVILFAIIPELIIIMILLFLFKVFEKKDKNKFDSQFIHLIIGGLFTYYIYTNIVANDVFTNFISKIYYYNIINLWLYVLLIFGIYYMGYKIFRIIKIIKKESLFGVLKNYKLLYYPVIIIIFIIILINIFNTFLISYLVHTLLGLISLEKIIDITTLINIPFDANIIDILPNTLSEFFTKLNINLDFALADIGLNANLINNLFDKFILQRIDVLIQNFLATKIDGYLFINVPNFIISICAIILIGIVEIYNEQKYLLNLILLIILEIFLYNIKGIGFSVIEVFIVIFILMFTYLVYAQNKIFIKKVIDNIKNKIEQKLT